MPAFSNRLRACHGGVTTGVLSLVAFVVTVLIPATASALILGGTGNDPLGDPGWPVGAAAVFNVRSRVAYWEGPPFGGGQWHAECRGNTDAFNEALEKFARIEAKRKQLVVHDGVGRSFWLNLNDEEEQRRAARMDWKFTVVTLILFPTCLLPMRLLARRTRRADRCSW